MLRLASLFTRPLSKRQGDTTTTSDTSRIAEEVIVLRRHAKQAQDIVGRAIAAHRPAGGTFSIPHEVAEKDLPAVRCALHGISDEDTSHEWAYVPFGFIKIDTDQVLFRAHETITPPAS